MDEAEVKAWLVEQLDVSRETLQRLDNYVRLLRSEARHQNLISTFSLPDVWNRHIRDSAQLLVHAKSRKNWLDLGSGAGLPGIVIALLTDCRVTLVESRRKRIDFLLTVIDDLGLASRAVVKGTSLERLETTVFDVIVARAFAPLGKLFEVAHRFAAPRTLWVLPKGKSTQQELADARAAWQGEFAVVQSVTDPGAGIVLARNVERRMGS